MNLLTVLAALLGIPLLLVVVLLAALSAYPKVRIVFADILCAVKFLGRWVRRRIIESELEGSINAFSEEMNAELAAPLLPECKVVWVTAENQHRYLQAGKAVIRLSLGPDHDLNFYNAAHSYVQTAVIPRAKPFLRSATREAIDFLTTKLLLVANRRAALPIFNDRFKAADTDCKETYYRLEDIEQAAIFNRLALQELHYFGESVGEKTPCDDHERETERFLEWVHDLATRTPQQRTILRFDGQHIKVGVILVADEETYTNYGISPYLRRAHDYAAGDVSAIYLLSRGRRADLTKRIARELAATGSFLVLNRKLDVVRTDLQGNPLIITCVVLKPDRLGLVHQAWQSMSRAYADQRPVTAVVYAVAEQAVTVQVFGLLIEVPLANLSALDLRDARKYFRVHVELSLKVTHLDREKQEVELSNLGTDTDPKRLVDLRLAGDRPVTARVTGIAGRDSLETGVHLALGQEGIRGFIPRFRATFGRFASLRDKYPLDSELQVHILDFNPEHATFTCQVTGLKDPWADLDTGIVGRQQRVIIREVTERYLTCELAEGVEGRTYVEEIAWQSPEENQAEIRRFQVGAPLDVVVVGIDKERRLLKLSVKRLQDSPTKRFSNAYCGKVVHARVKAVRARIGADIVFEHQDVKGFIPLSEVTWGFCEEIDEYLQADQRLDVKLIGYNDLYDAAVGSLKQCAVNCYEEFKAAFGVGCVVKGRPDRCLCDKYVVTTEIGGRQVAAYVHKAELSGQFFVDETIMSSMLRLGDTYEFTVKRFDDKGRVVELSRKQLLRSRIPLLRYGSVYDVRVVGERKGVLYVQGNEVEGALRPSALLRKKRPDSIRIIVARKDEQQGRVELEEAH